ncbi:MAG: LOG family protein [Alphaproteobacteria bacterium]|nr:LOG family protein [Alphaproteobacteria bacterium]
MTRPEKAYKNLEYLNSAQARPIRILCEYDEPRQRFWRHGVKDTIVIFGSARTLRPEVADQRLAAASAAMAAADGHDEALAEALADAGRKHRMSRYYGQARELSRRLTEWSMAREGERSFVICTGGGPGIMEAANRGAADVEGGRSVGLGISLPFEEKLNDWVTPELGFEFHYFFTRKYWFMYLAKALVVFPGGFGTIDEMAELLTLIQTGKIKKRVPIVLFGMEYWNSIFNFEAMVEWGTISKKDLDLFLRTDDPNEAFRYVTEALEHGERTDFGRLDTDSAPREPHREVLK